MSEQDTRATAEMDQLEVEVRDTVELLIDASRCVPPAMRAVLLNELVVHLGDYARACLIVIDERLSRP